MEFKYWLLIQESEILLGSKRSADSSGFCLHNPKINSFAKSNSTNMFIVFAFVFYLLGGEKTPTFSEGKSLVAKRVSDSERDCDQTSLG